MLPQRSIGSAGAPPSGVLSGIPALDEVAGGLQPGEVVLITGGPGTGKSALAFQWALHAARSGQGTVALVPLKHTPQTATQRLLGSLSRVELLRLRRGEASVEDRAALAEAALILEQLPLHVFAAVEPTWEDVLDRAMRLHRACGLRLVVLDGLHMLEPEGPLPASSADRLREFADAVRAPVILTAGSGSASGWDMGGFGEHVLHLTRAEGASETHLAFSRASGVSHASVSVRFHAGSLFFTSDP